jgi:hypothetical protein
MTELASKLVIHLQAAESFRVENHFDEEIRQTNRIWEHIKEKMMKDET